jgi:hypothetical protein
MRAMLTALTVLSFLSCMSGQAWAACGSAYRHGCCPARKAAPAPGLKACCLTVPPNSGPIALGLSAVAALPAGPVGLEAGLLESPGPEPVRIRPSGADLAGAGSARSPPSA